MPFFMSKWVSDSKYETEILPQLTEHYRQNLPFLKKDLRLMCEKVFRWEQMKEVAELRKNPKLLEHLDMLTEAAERNIRLMQETLRSLTDTVPQAQRGGASSGHGLASSGRDTAEVARRSSQSGRWWANIRNWFSNTGRWIGRGFSSAYHSIRDKFPGLVAAISGLVGAMKQLAKRVLGFIGRLLAGLLTLKGAAIAAVVALAILAIYMLSGNGAPGRSAGDICAYLQEVTGVPTQTSGRTENLHESAITTCTAVLEGGSDRVPALLAITEMVDSSVALAHLEVGMIGQPGQLRLRPSFYVQDELHEGLLEDFLKNNLSPLGGPQIDYRELQRRPRVWGWSDIEIASGAHSLGNPATTLHTNFIFMFYLGRYVVWGGTRWPPGEPLPTASVTATAALLADHADNLAAELERRIGALPEEPASGG